MKRIDGRRPNELRKVELTRGFTQAAAGSVLIRVGQTHVLCTATVEEKVPAWRESSGLGWVTAEYDMLPGSTGQRRPRNREGKIDGRAQEIQRLIGRSLRAVIDMAKLGQRTIWLDCDVLQADGGTRTASITGAYVALVDAVVALQSQGKLKVNPLRDSVAAVSVGVVKGQPLLDLCYTEDVAADTDFTVVKTGQGCFIEVQGTAEREPFSQKQMEKLLGLADQGIRELLEIQQSALQTRGNRKMSSRKTAAGNKR